jgi:Taurine catabolism dioxygenase TauD, TfdA family
MTITPQALSTGFLSASDPGAVATCLNSAGIALVDDIDSDATLLELARPLVTVVPHRDGGPTGITTISDRRDLAERAGMAGFGTDALAAHTDRSSLVNPPGLVLTVCRRAADRGGDSILVDGRAVYGELADSHLEALQCLSTPRSALFGGASGYLGSIFTHRFDGRVRVRLRWDSLARFSPDVSRVLPILRAVVDRHTVQIGLRPGQGYIVDNHRWLHGRREFTGDRTMSRLLGQPLAMTTGFPAVPVSMSLSGVDAGQPT